MRILILSDSHGKSSAVRQILDAQPDARYIFFLGDVTADIEDMPPLYPDKRFLIVSGNCDFFSLYPSSGIEIIGQHRIFYTHGHTLGVKYGTERLSSTARRNGCDIALYGHTHVSQAVYEDGLYLVNPGSCARPREGRAGYAFIDIEENGVAPVLVTL